MCPRRHANLCSPFSILELFLAIETKNITASVCFGWCVQEKPSAFHPTFPYQEMPSEIRAVTDANWAWELERLLSTSCGWIYFGDQLLETYSSTQQIVALSTAESEYISITEGAAHALEVHRATMEYGLTLKVVCETDPSAGRAMATRRGVRRVRHLEARLLWLQQLCAEGVAEV